MTIETKEFQVTHSELALIFLRDLCSRRWFVFLLILLFSLFAWDAGIVPIILVFISSSTGYFIYLVTLCWLATSPKGNSLDYAQRNVVIDHESVSTLYKNGSFSKYKFGSVNRIIRRKKYYVLFLTRHHFIFLPDRAFNGPTDRQGFETLLKVKT